MSGEWLQWYMLIYTLPAGVAILILLASGVGGHGAAHHGAVGPGGHVGPIGHAGHLAPGGHAGHIGHGAHGDSGTHGAHGHQAGHDGVHGAARLSAARQALVFLGVGRAPLNIVLGSLLIGWGLFGLVATSLLRPLLPSPAAFALPAMGVAAFGALSCAKVLGEIAERLLPQEESAALSREDLIGLTATVVYPVSETGGRIHVFDMYRTLHVESARSARPGACLAKGASVVIVGIDPARKVLLVADTPPDIKGL